MELNWFGCSLYIGLLFSSISNPIYCYFTMFSFIFSPFYYVYMYIFFISLGVDYIYYKYSLQIIYFPTDHVQHHNFEE